MNENMEILSRFADNHSSTEGRVEATECLLRRLVITATGHLTTMQSYWNSEFRKYSHQSILIALDLDDELHHLKRALVGVRNLEAKVANRTCDLEDLVFAQTMLLRKRELITEECQRISTSIKTRLERYVTGE